jgi:hypothetical protein
MNDAKAYVIGRIDGSSGAKITIDRNVGLISVRPYRRHREYTLPLLEVARHIVATVVRAEVTEKRKRHKVRRGVL